MTRWAMTCGVVALGLACGAERERPSDEGPSPADADADGWAPDGGGGGGGAPGGEPCGSSSCGARERCVESEDAPACACLRGFAGPRCEDVDECAEPEACGDHASCVDGYGVRSCVCEPGYAPSAEGACEDVDECGLVTCPDGASCVNEPGSFRCECPQGTVGSGLFCKPSPACGESSCSGHGECRETATGSVCSCDPGHSGPDCADVCDTLTFGDEALEAAVRALTQKPEGALTPADLEGHTSLLASGLGLESLDGLECWPGLEVLQLSDNALSADALSVIAQLNRLDTLVLDCNPIDELDWLTEHPTLRVLSLARPGPGCPSVTTPSLEPLGSVLGLERLELGGRALEGASLSPLAHLLRLRRLGLSSTGLSSAGLVALGSRPLLEELALAGNGLDDADVVAGHVGLRRLELSDNHLEQLGAVAELRRLERLGWAGNGLQALPESLDWPWLRELELSHNELADTAPLAGLPSLVWLALIGNDVRELTGWSEAPRGTWYLHGNPVLCDDELRAAAAPRLDAWAAAGLDPSPWPAWEAGCEP